MIRINAMYARFWLLAIRGDTGAGAGAKKTQPHKKSQRQVHYRALAARRDT
jgi:hypothetical protein